jgi:hypothetical protein
MYKNILGVFFGSTKRAQWTLVGICILLAALRPDVAQYLLFIVLNRLWMVFGAFLPLGIVFLGFWVMFRPLKSKKKDKH